MLSNLYSSDFQENYTVLERIGYCFKDFNLCGNVQVAPAYDMIMKRFTNTKTNGIKVNDAITNNT